MLKLLQILCKQNQQTSLTMNIYFVYLKNIINKCLNYFLFIGNTLIL